MARQPINEELLVTPDPLTPKIKLLIQRDAKTGRLGIFYTDNGGITFQMMIPAPTILDKVGSVLTIAQGGLAEWKPLSVPSPSPGVAAPTFVEMAAIGSLETSMTFGHFRVSNGMTLYLKEIHLYVQTPSDTAIQVDVLNGSNVRQNRVATIQPNTQKSVTILETPLKMASGTLWSMKVLQTGVDEQSGENLSARLVLTTTL